MDDTVARPRWPAAAADTPFAVPLVVAVTGHRDLAPAEIAAIRERVRRFLRDLGEQYPEHAVGVMSSLAEGADRLVAEVALELAMPLTVALPMEAGLYVEDFTTADSRAAFQRLVDAAVDVFELPPAAGQTRESLSSRANRDVQYAQLGVFLCAHCHILLALWDGRHSDSLGGTSQVVRFHHDDVMPGYTPRTAANRLILGDDESDLVYHIVCSRDRAEGGPADGLAPLDCWWFTVDETEPRTKEMPRRHRQVFERTREFSRDAQLYEEKIRAEGWPLVDEKNAAGVPPGARDIDRVFQAADWLAIRFQKRTLFALRATHVLALMMGFAYIFYAEIASQRVFVIAFVGFFLIAAVIHRIGDRGAWHRKYLDYRTLAEGLRVQFYWAVAGVTSGNVSKFAYDNFLQMQDPELGWIRSVMRVAGTECDVASNTDPAGLAYSLREWLGDSGSGQLGYYGRKAIERIRRHRRTERLALIVMWTGIAAAGLFIFATEEIVSVVREPVVVLLGLLLLLAGVRQSYGFSTADAELIKQYEFMHRIFKNARRRINDCENDQERRRALKALGEAALEEHAEWILMHRERSIDQGEIWRMSG